MRFFKYHFALLLNLLCHVHSNAQDTGRGDFYDSAKYYDFSKIWHSDSVLNLENVDGTFLSDPKQFGFPEPLGFIGNDYQRFYIHFTMVKKSKQNPYQYIVVGKTKVKKNICSFKGTITIDTVAFDLNTTFPVSAKLRRGYAICSCVFSENKSCKNSGVMIGRLGTDWCLYNGQIYYDNIMGDADGYSNNQFTGKWKSIIGSIVKKCNWGDYRIPDSRGLDIGAGDFSPNDEYLKNGWQSYHEQNDETAKGKKATALENAKWWR
jgi:hypothetical protein